MEKNTTIKMVADEAGVSEATVSRVINNSKKVKYETSQKVKKTIKELGYQPNELARSLRSNSTKTIGVIISNILNPFFTSVVRGIEDYANQNDYNVIICNTDENSEKEKRYVQTLINRKVDGLIIATTGNISNYRSLVNKTPVVFIDRIPHKDDRENFDIVLVENEVATYQAVSHLIKVGYRNIGIITGNDVSTTGYERLLGYKKALKEFDLPVQPDLIKVGSFLGDDSYKLASKLLTETNCDTIFSGNNMILMGTLKAVKNLNEIEKKIGLMSFDDEEWLNYSSLEIDSVKQPTILLGEKAIKILLDRISGQGGKYKEIRCQAELVIRKRHIK
ncbi:MAG: LacI family DNA-binding transcriptional regulator [Alkalibacterium gilvum]|uniref:LacI family DNA-binding transcriptional regulator n=1 Tax=Alkalibacterium gilvum TaxID=1130080 RepID=UPI003F93EDD3